MFPADHLKTEDLPKKEGNRGGGGRSGPKRRGSTFSGLGGGLLGDLSRVF